MRILVLAVILVTASAGWALKVSPGSFTAQDVPLGKVKDLGINLVCSAEGAKFVSVSVMPPNTEMPQCTGYRPLPNIDWFIIDSETLSTDSTGTARSKMKIFIPDSAKFYNQHFIARLFVTASGSGMFQPAIIPYYFIETPPLKNPSVPPDGEIGIAPSTVDLNIKKHSGSFVLFNNDTSTHKYKLTIRTPRGGSRRFPNLSPGFSTIADSTAIVLKSKTVNLKSGKRKNISLDWENSDSIGTPREAILLIESDNGTNNFVRIRMELK